MEFKRKKDKRYCMVSGCYNSTKKIPDLSLFSLPKDIERREQWLTSIGREDLLSKEDLKVKSYLVCAIHFEDSAIKTTKQLKNDAVPTRFLPNQSQEDIFHLAIHNKSSGIPSQTKSNFLILPNNTIRKLGVACAVSQKEIPVSSTKVTQVSKLQINKSPQKRKFFKDYQAFLFKHRRIDHENQNDLEANVPSTSDTKDDITQRFNKLMGWRNRIKHKFKDNVYNAGYKLFALNLHSCSPQMYRCLQTVLNLPSKSMISRFKLKIPDDQVLHCLLMKIKSLPVNAKYCTICIDKMVLKRNLYYDTKKDEVVGFHNTNGRISPEIASVAYIIMLQGIYFNWEQPISYAFLASIKHYTELDNWMNEVIRKLIRMGIEVKAIISDQDSDFDKYSKVIKHVTVDKPYFFVDERKIYYIFDVPCLLRSIRNNLLLSNFHHEGSVISWDHIVTLYEYQKEKNLRLIPKITNAHIEPNNLQRMSVKYAAQIFSGTVYAALETYIDFEKVTEEARATATFVKTMNDMFDVLNSSKVNSAEPLQTAFRISNEQKKILEDGQNMFASIKSTDRNTGKDNTNEIITFLNFQITINSVLQLFEDLKSEGFQYLFARRLNQDSLVNFIGAIKQKGGYLSEPTPIQFTRTFSELFLIHMLKSSPAPNSESDIYEILLKADDIINNQISIPFEEARSSLVALDGEIDYRMDLPKSNAVMYVAAYLLFKCSKTHKCDKIVGALNSLPGLDETKLFIDYEAYNKNSSFYGSLKMPPQELQQYVEKLETAFKNNIKKCVKCRPGSTIFELLKQISLPKLPCFCFPVDYFLKLFVRLRIFTTLKFNNRSLKAAKKSIKKYLKLKQL